VSAARSTADPGRRRTSVRNGSVTARPRTPGAERRVDGRWPARNGPRSRFCSRRPRDV